MHDRLDVLVCDHDGCEAQTSGPAVRLVRAARAAGWQVHEVQWLAISDDGPEIGFTDRCPDHPTEVMARETVLERAGGLGGIQPHHLW